MLIPSVERYRFCSAFFSMRTLLVASLLASAAGEAVELTGKSFDKKVGGKKAAFVKFLAPW